MERSIASLGVRGLFNLVFCSHLSNLVDAAPNLESNDTASEALALLSFRVEIVEFIADSADPIAANSAKMVISSQYGALAFLD
tara:strand:- start:150 stop:398 length:249 start_codon:yes stop_codon:yes gene_type:complete